MATLDLVISEFVVLAIVCILLLRHFTGPDVPLDVTISVYLSWVLGFVGILLIPYDMSIALVEDQHSSMMETVWKFVYWSTFLLAWVILPVQLEYHNSGHFTFVEKLLDALKRNVVAGIVAAVVGIIYIVYMVASHEGSPEEVVGFMMALGNTYGVFIIIVLMGTGLVSLPRRLWQMADYEKELQRLYISAGGIEASYQEARYELEDCELDVVKAAELVQQSVRSDNPLAAKYVGMLQQKVANFTFLARSQTRKYVHGENQKTKTVEDSSLISKAGLVDLHARLMNAQVRAGASDRRWRLLLRQCKRVEGLVNSSMVVVGEESTWCQMKTEVNAGAASRRNCGMCCGGCCCCCGYGSRCSEVIQQLWNKRGFKICSRVLATVCALLSALILWSEMVMSSSLHSPIGVMMGAYSTSASPAADGNDTGARTVLTQAVAFVALSYMSICTYWSLFRVNIGWAYAMQGPQQSSTSALIFNGEYLSRLQFPLGNNFLMILNAPRMGLTAFSNLMANIQLVPVFGTSFQVYIPLFMIIVAVMTIFQVFARLLVLVGVESEDAAIIRCCGLTAKTEPGGALVLSEDEREKYELGKKLIASELRQRAVMHSSLATHKSHEAHRNNRQRDDSGAVYSDSGERYLGGEDDYDEEAAVSQTHRPPRGGQIGLVGLGTPRLGKGVPNKGVGDGTSSSSSFRGQGQQSVGFKNTYFDLDKDDTGDYRDRQVAVGCVSAGREVRHSKLGSVDEDGIPTFDFGYVDSSISGGAKEDEEKEEEDEGDDGMHIDTGRSVSGAIGGNVFGGMMSSSHGGLSYQGIAEESPTGKERVPMASSGSSWLPPSFLSGIGFGTGSRNTGVKATEQVKAAPTTSTSNACSAGTNRFRDSSDGSGSEGRKIPHSKIVSDRSSGAAALSGQLNPLHDPVLHDSSAKAGGGFSSLVSYDDDSQVSGHGKERPPLLVNGAGERWRGAAAPVTLATQKHVPLTAQTTAAAGTSTHDFDVFALDDDDDDEDGADSRPSFRGRYS